MPISPLTLCFHEDMILYDKSPKSHESLSPRSHASLSSLSPPPLVRHLTSPSSSPIQQPVPPISQPRPIPCLQYLEPYQQFSTSQQHHHHHQRCLQQRCLRQRCRSDKLKEFNDTIEWHQQNAINGNPIPINMLFLMSLIDPIHKLYKRDNNSIQNWCFRDIYLATFGTQPIQSLPSTDMTKMYIEFYNSVIYK
jgi:hypothetical protein